MALRTFKIVLTLFIALQALLYVAGNLTNWDSAVATVGYVLSQQEHLYYPNHIFPAITSKALTIAALLTIVTAELSVGLLTLKGTWDMWCQRNSDAISFNQSKKFALIGCLMAMVVWFGGFIVIGGALFQMWQTQVGEGSWNGAFLIGGISALVYLVVEKEDA